MASFLGPGKHFEVSCWDPDHRPALQIPGQLLPTQSGAQEGAVGALGGGEFKESLARKALNTKPVGGLSGGGQWAGSKIGTNRAQKVDRMVQLRESRCLQRKDSPPDPLP